MEEFIQPHIVTTRFDYYFIKRSIDIVGSLLLIIILSPMYVFITLLIFFRSGFPILYPWRIIGFKGKPLPENWLGKPYILSQAISKAKGEYLLFTDADPIFEPFGLFMESVTIQFQMKIF